MSAEGKAYYEEYLRYLGKMKQEMPNIVTGFNGLFQKVMGEGALTVREKELIALGIAVAIRCHPCIYAHVKKCIEAGISKEEMHEAAGVVVMMQGGPGFTYAAEVVKAYEALAE